MQQPVGQRRLAVVNMGNDAEISYVCRVHLKNVQYKTNIQ
jgi:hypothetical protein